MMAGISSPRGRGSTAARHRGAERAARCPRLLDEVATADAGSVRALQPYNCCTRFYGELGVFGTGLWVDEDEETWCAAIRSPSANIGSRARAGRGRHALRSISGPSARSSTPSARCGLRRHPRQLRLGPARSRYEIIHAIEPNPNSLAGGPDAHGRQTRQPAPPSARVVRARPAGRALAAQGVRLRGVRPWRPVGMSSAPIPGFRARLVALGDSSSCRSSSATAAAIQKMHKPPMVGPPELRNEPQPAAGRHHLHRRSYGKAFRSDRCAHRLSTSRPISARRRSG